jgi:hypothetical protein
LCLDFRVKILGLRGSPLLVKNDKVKLKIKKEVRRFIYTTNQLERLMKGYLDES